MRVHWSAGLRDNLLPWHDVTGKQSYRSRLILFADYCFGPPTFVYRLFLLSCNRKINWKPSSGRSQEMKCSKRLIHKQLILSKFQVFVAHSFWVICRNDSCTFVELCMETPYWCTVLVHQYDSQKSTKTSGVHFFYKSSFFHSRTSIHAHKYIF